MLLLLVLAQLFREFSKLGFEVSTSMKVVSDTLPRPTDMVENWAHKGFYSNMCKLRVPIL